MSEEVRAFIAAYDAFREAEHDYLALGGYVAPPEDLVRERRERFSAAARALEVARAAIPKQEGKG